MKRLVFVNIRDNVNLGDMACSPRDYFEPFKRFKAFDFRHVPNEYLGKDTLMIIGGGGMMHPGVDEWIERRIKSQPVVTWGIGHNYHEDQETPIPSLDKTEERLLGAVASLRDRDVSRVEWVPCVTCMSHLFDGEMPEPIRDVLYLSHYNYHIPMPDGEKQINNHYSLVNNMGTVVRDIISAKAIVTSTFHGMYWSLLLGKPVVVFNPQSSRYRSGSPIPTKHLHITRDPKEANELAHYLADQEYGYGRHYEVKYGKMIWELPKLCRRRNAEFYADVLRRIDDFSGNNIDRLSA